MPDHAPVRDAYFDLDGDLFVPTGLTRGPWSDDHQHGGPPAALIGRALERFEDPERALFVARFQMELLRPIPIRPIAVAVRRVHGGKTVDRVEGTLACDGTVVARALALRIRRRPVETGTGVTTPPHALPAPEELEPFVFPFFRHPVGYHRSVEIRFARGTWGERDVAVWMRALPTTVAGDPSSPLERVLAVVDSQSGVCPPLDPVTHTFLNPDLTVYLERPLVGGWVGMAARSCAQSIGVGLSESGLFDAAGTFGRSAQSLVVAAR